MLYFCNHSKEDIAKSDGINLINHKPLFWGLDSKNNFITSSTWILKIIINKKKSDPSNFGWLLCLSTALRLHYSQDAQIRMALRSNLYSPGVAGALIRMGQCGSGRQLSHHRSILQRSYQQMLLLCTFRIKQPALFKCIFKARNRFVLVKIMVC